MHRTKVRVVEGVLDANDTIARANRADFDAAGVTVINLMSAPGAGKTTLLERGAGAGRVAGHDLEPERERVGNDLAQRPDAHVHGAHRPPPGVAQDGVDDRGAD